MDTGIDLPFDDFARWWAHSADAWIPAICLGGLLLCGVTLFGLNMIAGTDLSAKQKNVGGLLYAAFMAGAFGWLTAQRLRREKAEREILAREDRAILGGDDETQP